MIIQRATHNQLAELMDFYARMCQVLDQKSFLPEGNKGGFPTHEMVREAIDQHAQFVGLEEGRIVAAYIMNSSCDPAYHSVKWQLDLAPNEAAVLHALRVDPAYGGRGFATELVQHAIRTAPSFGYKAIRLDCIEGNTVPHKMYAKLGFSYIDTVTITYPDIGVPRSFLLFEYVCGQQEEH